jgi:hypothetical protein
MRLLFILLSIFVASFHLQATHLMGGEITWECVKIGPDAGKYIFNVRVYRDCQGVPISTSMNLDVHNVPGLSTISLLYLGSNDISPLCNTINGSNTPFSCGGVNTQTGNGNGAVEEHLYQSAPIEINGTPDANGWHFTWSGCCRNLAVTNLLNNTGQYGFTLRAVMYSYTDSSGNVFPSGGVCYDSSPKFYEKPRTILEVNNGYDPLAVFNGFTYSHNAFDEEQDSLSYTWGMPLDDGNYDFLNPNSTALSFSFPYSYTNPIDNIDMDTASGRTSYPANQQGNYVTCTNVSAYKCGQLVSEIFREVQVVLLPPICNLGDTTNGNIGADTLCNVRPQVQPPFFYSGAVNPFQWDTMVHCGDTVRFNFEANDYDFYPNGTRQDLKFEVSGGQFMNYNVSPPALCNNPPCATFEEISTGNSPPFTSSGGNGEGHFEWITSLNHVVDNCAGDIRPSLYTFVIKVQDDFCPAPAIENTSQVISIYVFPPCSLMKSNASSTAATCLVDGTISIAPSGGFPPYTSYYFDMNGIPVNPTAVSAGDYQVLVVDSSQCETLDTVTVLGPLALSFSTTITNVICNGFNDGSANIIAQVATPPFTYLWSNGDTTQTIVNLFAGFYSVLVTDSNGCLFSDTILITEPDPLVVDSVAINNISCFGGNNGSINISVSGGTPFYSYLWSDGSTSEDISSLSAGLYSVVVNDANGCSSNSNTYTITEPALIQNINVVTSASCVNSNDGSIDISVSGGSPSYSYLWSNGDTTEDITGLASGTYTIEITDNNACLFVDTILITEPNPLVVDSAIVNNLSCFSGNNGSIDIGISGGTPSYSYLWSNGSTSEDISSLTAGLYSVVVNDANGCSSNFYSYIITEPAQIQNIAVVTPVSCFGSNDGSIDISVSGGSASYSYLWSNGDTIQDVTGLASGTYTIEITDNNGCSIIDSIFIMQPSILSASLISSNGGLSGIAVGGTLPYNYDFYGPSGLVASTSNNQGTAVVISPTVSGIHSLIVTDLNGCIDSVSTNFNFNFSPVVIVSLSNNYCDSLSDLTIEVSQDSGEVDMSTAIFQSTAGSFDIASMSVGDTIGTATLMAQGGLIMINTYLMVSLVVNTNQAIICANDSVLGCIGSFTINNNAGSGIYILTNTVPDGNSYTLGNMSSVTFVNCFINPCAPFSFDATINSELGDVYNETFWFGITSIKDVTSSNLKIYPNPSSGELNVQFANNRSKVRLFLTDILGKDIYINKTYYNIIEAGISLSHLAKGSYILIIESDTERFSEIIMYK